MYFDLKYVFHTDLQRPVLTQVGQFQMSVYLNQELKVEKDVAAGTVILCLACYKTFNKFVRSDDSLNELSKTDGYLTKCLSQFDQVEYCNVDSDNLDRKCKHSSKFVPFLYNILPIFF
jgi:hypothetical protein